MRLERKRKKLKIINYLMLSLKAIQIDQKFKEKFIIFRHLKCSYLKRKVNFNGLVRKQSYLELKIIIIILSQCYIQQFVNHNAHF